MMEYKLRMRSFESNSYMILSISTYSDISDKYFNLSRQPCLTIPRGKSGERAVY